MRYKPLELFIILVTMFLSAITSLTDRWRKGGHKLARDGVKRNLPQIQSPIWLSSPSHSQSQQSSITSYVEKLIGTIGASKKVLTLKNMGTKDWSKRFNLSVFAMGVVDVWLAYQGITGTLETQDYFYNYLAE